MLFQRWIAGNQHISFDEFKNSLKNTQHSQDDEISVEDILREVKAILDQTGGEDL